MDKQKLDALRKHAEEILEATALLAGGVALTSTTCPGSSWVTLN